MAGDRSEEKANLELRLQSEDKPNYEYLDRPFIVQESGAEYEAITRKVFERFPNTSWINGERDSDGKMYGTFFTIYDSKYLDLEEEKIVPENLHMLGFPLDESIKNIRSLTAEHLPLLEAMEDHKKIVAKDHNLGATEIHAFLHYFIQCNRLHVHYKH
ncbi:MAG: hypothetical protein MHMPM18_000169 [Marteilia pararefringens]